MTRWGFVAGIVLLTAAALAMRLPALEHRPMHGDEAIHTARFADLWQRGQYEYDGRDYHGPTLYYATLPVVLAAGAEDYAATSEWMYRLVPVLFGAALVLLLAPAGTGLGRPAAAWAALLTAVSPAMVFFSRYYIQEMLLVFFTFAAILAGRRHIRTGGAGWALLAGACLGLMHATKETALLAWAAMAAGLAGAWLWRRASGPREATPGAAPPEPPPRLRPAVIAAALATGLVVSGLMVSVLLRRPGAILDSWLTYLHYLQRAGGAGLHEAAWHEYLRRLLGARALPRLLREPFGPQPAFSEAWILLLALVGAGAVVLRRGPARADAGLWRFLLIYTVVLTAVYSAIPYKTPWSILSGLHGMILLAGLGAAELVRTARRLPAKAVVAALLLVPAAQLAWQAWPGPLKSLAAIAPRRLPAPPGWRYAADSRNPYVYAHPLRGVLEVPRRLDELAALRSEGRALRVKVIAPAMDAWPLPWYLRQFTNVGYYHALPADVDAPVVVTSLDWDEPVRQRMRLPYRQQHVGLRDGVFLLLYVRQDLWEALVAPRRLPGPAPPEAVP